MISHQTKTRQLERKAAKRRAKLAAKREYTAERSTAERFTGHAAYAAGSSCAADPRLLSIQQAIQEHDKPAATSVQRDAACLNCGGPASVLIGYLGNADGEVPVFACLECKNSEQGSRQLAALVLDHVTSGGKRRRDAAARRA